MTAVADDLADIRSFAIKPGPKCTIGIALRHMDPTLRDKVQRAMGIAAEGSDRGITWKAIAGFLAAHDYQFAPQTLSRHQHGDCNCG